MCAGLGVDQLSRYSDTISSFANAAFEHIPDAKLTANIADIRRLSLVGEARIAGDYEKPACPRKRRDDVLCHSVGKVLLLGISAHVLEWQDCNRWLVGKSKWNLERGRGST